MLLISRSESSDIKDIIPFLINDNNKNNYNNDINKDKEKFSMKKYINIIVKVLHNLSKINIFSSLLFLSYFGFLLLLM